MALTAPWRAESSLRRAAVDASALTQLSSEEIIDRFLQEEDLRIVAGVTQNALDLGMPRLAYDHHAVPLVHQALGCHMDLLHVGAGGVDHVEAALAGSIDYLRHHAVGADDHGAGCGIIQVLGQANACLSELAYHDGVMDERPQGMDLSALTCLRCGG